MESIPVQTALPLEPRYEVRGMDLENLTKLSIVGLSLCLGAWAAMQTQTWLWVGASGLQRAALASGILVVAYIGSRLLMGAALRPLGFLLGTGLLGVGLSACHVLYVFVYSVVLIPSVFCVLVAMNAGGGWVRSSFWRRWCAPMEAGVPVLAVLLRVFVGLQFIGWGPLPANSWERSVTLWLGSGLGTALMGIQAVIAVLLALFAIDRIQRQEPATSATEAGLLITESIALWNMSVLFLMPRLFGFI